MEKETIIMKKTTLWQIITGVLAVLLIISIFTGGFKGNNNNTNVNNNDNAGNQGNNVPTGVATVNAEDYVGNNNPYIGSKNAKLTIVEFSDFQCPYCKKFRDDTFDQIKQQYVDTGKVKFVYRNFPLTSIHPMAEKTAEAGECAYEQGKFWEYHDKIFAEQSSLSIDSLKLWAKDIGLDTTKFNSCLDSGKYANEVKNDLNDATSSGGQGTPYFLVGNTQLSGAYPFSAFQQAIEAQL